MALVPRMRDAALVQRRRVTCGSGRRIIMALHGWVWLLALNEALAQCAPSGVVCLLCSLRVQQRKKHLAVTIALGPVCVEYFA